MSSLRQTQIFGATLGAAVSCAFDPIAGIVSGAVSNPGGVVSGLTVSIFIDGAGSPAGTATTASDGSWSYTPSGLSAGAHTFVAKCAIPISGSGGGTVTVTSAPGGGPNNTADFSDPNNAYLVAAAM